MFKKAMLLVDDVRYELETTKGFRRISWMPVVISADAGIHNLREDGFPSPRE